MPFPLPSPPMPGGRNPGQITRKKLGFEKKSLPGFFLNDLFFVFIVSFIFSPKLGSREIAKFLLHLFLNQSCIAL
jgi:hypothetical protein